MINEEMKRVLNGEGRWAEEKFIFNKNPDFIIRDIKRLYARCEYMRLPPTLRKGLSGRVRNGLDNRVSREKQLLDIFENISEGTPLVVYCIDGSILEDKLEFDYSRVYGTFTDAQLSGGASFNPYLRIYATAYSNYSVGCRIISLYRIYALSTLPKSDYKERLREAFQDLGRNAETGDFSGLMSSLNNPENHPDL